MCVSLCTTVVYNTEQNRTVLIIFPLIFRTTAQILFTAGRGKRSTKSLTKYNDNNWSISENYTVTDFFSWDIKNLAEKHRTQKSPKLILNF